MTFHFHLNFPQKVKENRV